MIFMKKEALAQVFSCEFWEIFKNTYLYRTPLVAASKVGLTDYVKKKNALKMILLKDLSSLEEYIYNKLCICIIKVSIQKNNISSSKYIWMWNKRLTLLILNHNFLSLKNNPVTWGLEIQFIKFQQQE